MTKPNPRAELAALRVAALEDVMKTSDADLRREAVEDGEDVAAIAHDVRSGMRSAAAGALRQRLANAIGRISGPPALSAPNKVRPSIDRLKMLVQQAFASDRSLGLAFRDGKRQSDADWESLYEDLVALGKIDPESDAD
jgi:hypothetical protein